MRVASGAASAPASATSLLKSTLVVFGVECASRPNFGAPEGVPVVRNWVLVLYAKVDCPFSDQLMVGDACSTIWGMAMDAGISHGELTADADG